MKWVKTLHKGIRYREHETRKHGLRADRYYSIRFKLDGRDVEEGLGWESDWKAKGLKSHGLEQEAVIRLAELKRNQRGGEGPATLREKRKAEVERRARQEIERIEEERVGKPFSVWWGEYVKDTQEAGKKKSLNREESFYRHWIGPVLGKRAMGEIAEIHLQRIKANMEKKELAPRSIQYCMAVIRQIFNFAKARGYGGAIPCLDKRHRPVVDNKRVRFFTREEADDLLDYLKERSLDSWRITLVSLNAGLRFGEIAKLTWGDLDLGHGLLFIRKPKNTHSRFAPMNETVRVMFEDMEPGEPSDLVFPAKGGNRRIQMSDTFDRAVDALGLNDGVADPHQKVCFHTCRHTCGSWLVQGGVDLLTVKELLGHRSLDMTLRYSHLRPDGLKQAVLSLDRGKGEANARRVRQAHN